MTLGLAEITFGLAEITFRFAEITFGLAEMTLGLAEMTLGSDSPGRFLFSNRHKAMTGFPKSSDVVS
jgi:hypothetical protein